MRESIRGSGGIACDATGGPTPATAQLMAACVDFDGRSRLRGPVRGSSERFHAICEGGRWFACDSLNHSPGRQQPAHSVPVALRCRRAACAAVFARGDAALVSSANRDGVILTVEDLRELRAELQRADLRIYSVVVLAAQDLDAGKVGDALSRLKVDADKLRCHETPINEMLARVSRGRSG